MPAQINYHKGFTDKKEHEIRKAGEDEVNRFQKKDYSIVPCSLK